MAGKNGGARPGAGRKPGIASIEAERTRDFIAQKIATNIGPIVEAQIKKAIQGDSGSFRELMDRAFGKAAQSVALDMKGNISVLFDDAFKDSK